jgi:hypothetical protein
MLYVIYTVLNLLFTGLAYVLAPFVALYCKDDGYLPKWLSWFQTFDAPLDAGWQDGYFKILAPGPKPTGAELWWLRTRWLWRNPAYGFAYWPLGEVFDPKEWIVTKYESGADYTNFHAQTKDGRLWCVSYNGVWGSWKLGWKAWNYFQGMDEQGAPKWSDKPWGPEWRVPHSFTPNIIKGITRLFAGAKTSNA